MSVNVACFSSLDWACAIFAFPLYIFLTRIFAKLLSNFKCNKELYKEKNVKNTRTIYEKKTWRSYSIVKFVYPQTNGKQFVWCVDNVIKIELQYIVPFSDII